MVNKSKIFILAFVGSNNLGDEVIFKSLITRLGLLNLGISALTKNINRTRQYGVIPVSSIHPGRIFKAIREADVVILGGGGLLQDATSIYNLPYFTLIVLFAQFLGKSTFIISVGAGPITTRLGKYLVSQVVKRADLITTRDSSSLRLLLELGANPKQLHLVTDPALDFKLSHFTDLSNFNLEKFKKKRYVLVSLRHWFDTRRLLPVSLNRWLIRLRGKSSLEFEVLTERIASFLEYISNELEVCIVFVSFFGSRDLEVAKKVAKRLHSSNIRIIEKPIDAYEYVKMAQNAEFVVAMRLHAAILATANGRPVLAFSYSEKVKLFMESLGLGDYVLSLEDINSSFSKDCVKHLYKQRGNLANEIAKAATDLRKLNDKNFTLISEYLSKIAREFKR